ncbi:ino eighty subunit 2-like [Phaseolus vulgaris]|uniref:ino eighty subunit 2-like n=1 Tax=Phaseolus vulgaris TaxID=3885 RepID=UPI0035C9FFD3
MWYSCGGCEELENRLEVLIDDGGAIEMLKIANTHGDGVELEGVEGNVEDGGGVEPKGVEVDVEDGGGVDIGEHHGMEGVVEEDEEEDKGHSGQGNCPPIDEDMECDNDGVDNDDEIEVQSEGTIDKGEGTTDKGESQGLRFEGEVRHRRRRQANNPIQGLEANCTDDLQDLGVDDDESEGTFVHDRGLLDTEWDS